ncbi:transposase [Streptomyces virginiae]|uniref:transposase n=1 Tax=Streptomyces virginiae TaxID=1961 RepID=UPI003634B80E
MTNSRWARLEPLLPQGIKPDRPQVWTRRQRVAGTRWRTRTGAPWRHVPERYGPWGRVYDLFRRRRRDGTWAQILTPLQAAPDAKSLITWEIDVGSTVSRAHPPACRRCSEKGDLQKGPPGGVFIEPTDQGLGHQVRQARRDGRLGKTCACSDTSITSIPATTPCSTGRKRRAPIPELRALVDSSAAEEAEAVHKILALTVQVERKAHRYLDFNGD